MDHKVIWMTGLSGSGKSTLSNRLRYCLDNSVVLDGDVVRGGLCSDLGFSIEDRVENIRRIACVAKILVNSNIDVIVPVISPTNEIRNVASSIIGDKFFLVWVDCSLEVCINRDVKGLYRKALNNEIDNFTGVSSPYEEPNKYDVVCDTDRYSVDLCVNYILKKLNRNTRIGY